MSIGVSLHIGLNEVNSEHYDGWNGKLGACENDARDMERIASSQGFKTKLLLSGKATRKNIIFSIRDAAKRLSTGDIFYLSYSGHGGQLPDLNGDEPDGQDETWCLYDGQFPDDEINDLWFQFSTGIRIFVTSDSCHSGTMIKEAGYLPQIFSPFTPRCMDSPHALSTYSKNIDFYNPILSSLKKLRADDLKSEIILISGCQDNQYSYDGTFNGAFTAALKRVWNGGKFNKDYRSFHKQIQNLMPDYQSPNFLTFGKKNQEFECQKPFSI